MNKYWLVALLVFICGIGFAGERYGENRIKVQCEKHDEAQQQNTIAAQQHVITQIGVQDNISKEETNAYQTTLSSINSLYGPVSLPATSNPASGNLRPIPAAADGTATSRKYHLTLKQCDAEEAKCNALWNWAQQQSAIK